MVTIMNTNEEYGRPACTTAETLELAVASMQAEIRACGDEFASVVVTNEDYEIIAAPCGDCGATGSEYLDDRDVWLCPSCAEQWTNCWHCNANIRLRDVVTVADDDLCPCCAAHPPPPHNNSGSSSAEQKE